MSPTTNPRMTVPIAYKLWAIITTKYAEGAPIPTVDFDDILKSVGAMADNVPKDNQHPDWGSRVHQRSKAKAVMNRIGKREEIGLQIVQLEHPGRNMLGGSLTYRNPDRFAVDFASRKAHALPTHYKGVKAQVRHIRKHFILTDSADRLLERIEDDAEMDLAVANLKAERQMLRLKDLSDALTALPSPDVKA